MGAIAGDLVAEHKSFEPMRQSETYQLLKSTCTALVACREQGKSTHMSNESANSLGREHNSVNYILDRPRNHQPVNKIQWMKRLFKGTLGVGGSQFGPGGIASEKSVN